MSARLANESSRINLRTSADTKAMIERAAVLMCYPDTFRVPVSDTQAYQLFSQALVVPLVEYAAKLMVLQLNLREMA